MGELFDRIKAALDDDRYVIGAHANLRLRQRRIPAWQVVMGVTQGRLIRERPDDAPNPSVEVEQWLTDGTPVLAAWAWLERDREAKLITVHFFDR